MLFAILTFMIYNFSCSTNHDYFPNKRNVLTSDFNQYDNFFPIATLDLLSKGIKDKIHVMYVSLDPSIDHKKPFPGNDYIDVFSFKISDEGKLLPTFDKSVLAISKDFKEYFVKDQEKYSKTKQENRASSLIDLTDEPEWWQDDAAPVNSKDKPMRFICQVDMNEFSNDDCRLFIFYDEVDRVIKYIYQRD
ncbi:MAG TPA: hypothetical protein VF609_09185 [Flavisolibacter sp.]|jgi:hypothetical protein